ncbi:MAG: hypothetical protein J0H49_32625 [Acidobacteria bacterium]|nr:hypothetical protein [Acidobacteriota bacterium]
MSAQSNRTVPVHASVHHPAKGLPSRVRKGAGLLFAALSLGAWPGLAQTQTPPPEKDPARTQPGTLRKQEDATLGRPSTTAAYTKPTEATEFRNYLFSAFGPYPIVGAAFAAGISQAGNGVPEWGQGAEGFGKRMGSNFAIGAVSTTTRYALSAAFDEDAVYYPCQCKGPMRRLGHAVLSTVTARRGADGHRVLSLPAIVAPYAGATTAVYGWYPDRYSAKDAFRMGNYSLLANVGGNIAMEFLFRSPNSWLSKLRLNNRPAAGTGTGR